MLKTFNKVLFHLQNILTIFPEDKVNLKDFWDTPKSHFPPSRSVGMFIVWAETIVRMDVIWFIQGFIWFKWFWVLIGISRGCCGCLPIRPPQVTDFTWCWMKTRYFSKLNIWPDVEWKQAKSDFTCKTEIYNWTKCRNTSFFLSAEVRWLISYYIRWQCPCLTLFFNVITYH